MKRNLPWFGPKTGFGWGWRPVTWQGWAVTALFIACITGISYAAAFAARFAVFAAIVVVYLIVVVATGTKPGGRFR
jgi:hypothetical protein